MKKLHLTNRQNFTNILGKQNWLFLLMPNVQTTSLADKSGPIYSMLNTTKSIPEL